MKQIGGYFELERGPYRPLHDGILLNSGRSALRLIVRLLKISRIHVPFFTCPVVPEALRAEGCDIIPYELDASLMPACDFPKEDFVLANNYFGVTDSNIAQLAEEYPNLIVDNAQAYYALPKGRAAFYSPRKFFGLPDGGIAVFSRDSVDIPELETDQSYKRMDALLKRHDLGPEAGYADFKKVSHELAEAPVRAMSNLTRTLISSFDASAAALRREENFSILHTALGAQNVFPFAQINGTPSDCKSSVQQSVPLVYPFVSQDMTLRQKLIDNRIFVAKYWPDCNNCDNLVNTILPLPLDQRYDKNDMNRLLEVING